MGAVETQPSTTAPARSLAGIRRWRVAGLDRRAVMTWGIVPLAIMLLAWQPVALEPAGSIDPSWMAGVSLAIHNGVTFGNHAIFTYGPLGFLSNPVLWYAGTGTLSFLYMVALRFGLALALFLGARRTFGVVASFLIAVVVASVVGLGAEPAILLIVLVAALQRELAPRPALALSAAAGALAGLELLNKASLGITLAAMTAVFVICLPRGRRFAVLAAVGGFLGAFLVCWFASGQRLGSLPDYLKYTEQVVSGYASAMSLRGGDLGWQSTAAVLTLLVGLWGALHTTAGGTARQRAGVALVWLAFWFFLFKEGFVRHDGGHALLFFQAMLAGLFAFGWRAGYRLTALICAGALLTVVLAAESVTITTLVHPVSSVRAAVTDVRNVASPSRRDGIIAAGRRSIETEEGIDPTTLSLIRDHSVTIYPTEIALAWAYRLHWDPIPVLQSYSAYTTALDRLDADFLQSSRAPQRILIQGPTPSTIDGRVLSFDQGITSRAILCRYQELHATPSYAVLGLTASRCGGITSLGTIRAGWGQTVSVPPPPNDHSLVFVRINGVQVSGLEQLRALVFKPAQRHVVLNGNQPIRRLVTGTAADGLPLRAAPGVDFPPPYNISIGITTLAVLKDGQHGPGGKPITYSFYAESIDRRAALH